MEIPELTINSFFRNAVIDDFARDYLFRITRISFDDGELLDETDLLFAKTGKLPARQLVNHQVKYAGQTFNVPGSVEFPGSESYAMDFYCPETSSIRERLMNESVRTFNNFYGIAGSGQGGGSIASDNSTIELIQFNKNLDALYRYELVGCSIREVGEVAYNIAEGNGAVMSFNVGVAYHFFRRYAVGPNLVVPTNEL